MLALLEYQATHGSSCADDAPQRGAGQRGEGHEEPHVQARAANNAGIAALRARFDAGHFRHAMRADLSCFAAGAAALRQEAHKPAN